MFFICLLTRSFVRQKKWGAGGRRVAWASLAAGAIQIGFIATTAAANDSPPAKSADAKEDKDAFAGQVVPFLAKYCNDCHSGADAEAGLSLADFRTPDTIDHHRRSWRKIAEKLRTKQMPPKDSEQPADEAVAEITKWIDGAVEASLQNAPREPGRVTMRRLNRAEYANTIHDLLGIDFRGADDFPVDDLGYGFDNIGDVLSLPSLLLEKYLAAAETIVEQVIWVPDGKSGPSRRYPAQRMEVKALVSTKEFPGRMLRTNGEVYLDHEFAAGGQYLIRVRAWGQQAGDEPAKMVLKLDDKEVSSFEVKADADAPESYEHRQEISAGRHKLAAAFVNNFFDPHHPDFHRRDRNLIVESVEVIGPVWDGRDAPPESHRRLMIADPNQVGKAEAARQILRGLANRAYRRPVTDEELNRLMELFDGADRDGLPFERGIQLAATAVLVSPHFLFRIESDPPDVDKDQKVRSLNDWELASRLSYFLWSSMPDDELFGLASRGELRANLEQQVLRMMRDQKAQRFVENFAGQWLQTRLLDTLTPDKSLFPAWDGPLKEAMKREPIEFFGLVMREDRSILEFLTAEYAMLNEELAKFYGVKEIAGPDFRKVELSADVPRGGVLTMASVLAITSNPNRTSPVKRGKWVMETLLGTPPPPPPPEVPQLAEEHAADPSAPLRDRLELHRKNPQCAVCHAPMDPLGFGLENFDAIGAWRERDGKFEIDSSGTLPDGETFRGPEELKKLLLGERDQFCRALAGKMLTYALGRGTEETDEPVIRDIAAAVAKNDYRFSSLVLAIVNSPAFQKCRVAEKAQTTTANPTANQGVSP